jgi:hypothetical protein
MAEISRFNKGGGDNDFRIEGNTDDDLFFVDASVNNVGIGTTSPNEKLTVEGTLSLDEVSPPSETSGYGKLYVKTNHDLWYKNQSGNERNLINPPKAVMWLLPGSAKLPNSAFARPEKITRTNGIDNILKFDADGTGSDESAYFQVPCSNIYKGGNLNITVYALSGDSDDTKKANFHIEVNAKQDNETWDAAFVEIARGDIMAADTTEN